mmetsp:Transcript_6379/g.11989  ORF Transcript_6379/g.11989 Transcript_6379/m.11989 type:complete len:88 (-) Transcript_6379:177-440(-)
MNFIGRSKQKNETLNRIEGVIGGGGLPPVLDRHHPVIDDAEEAPAGVLAAVHQESEGATAIEIVIETAGVIVGTGIDGRIVAAAGVA